MQRNRSCNVLAFQTSAGLSAKSCKVLLSVRYNRWWSHIICPPLCKRDQARNEVLCNSELFYFVHGHLNKQERYFIDALKLNNAEFLLHAWITFIQSLHFLSPVDFLTELLPKGADYISACMFFPFFLFWGMMLWTPRPACALQLHW